MPDKGTLTIAPAQTLWFTTSLTVGIGLMVIVNVRGVPEQPLMVGVTVIVAVCCVVTVGALYVMLPLPDVGKPIAALEFVHETVVPLGEVAKT